MSVNEKAASNEQEDNISYNRCSSNLRGSEMQRYRPDKNFNNYVHYVTKAKTILI